MTILFVLLSYLAASIFIGGTLYRLVVFAKTPSPLKIPVTPQPTNVGGVIVKNAIALSTFASLWKANRWTWVGGYALHLILLLVLLRHLRYFLEPVPDIIRLTQPFGMWAGVLLPLPLLYLGFLRRKIDRLAYISSGADFIALGLLFFIAVTGISLKFLAHADVVAIKMFIMGLITFSPQPMVIHPVFILHYLLVMVLVVYFPFSKFMHSGGLFFSPTRTQVDNVREVHYANPWGGK